MRYIVHLELDSSTYDDLIKALETPHKRHPDSGFGYRCLDIKKQITSSVKYESEKLK